MPKFWQTTIYNSTSGSYFNKIFKNIVYVIAFNGMNNEWRKTSKVKVSNIMLRKRLNEAGYHYRKAKQKSNLII